MSNSQQNQDMRATDLKQQIHEHFPATEISTCTIVPLRDLELDEHLPAWRRTTAEQEQRKAMEII